MYELALVIYTKNQASGLVILPYRKTPDLTGFRFDISGNMYYNNVIDPLRDKGRLFRAKHLYRLAGMLFWKRSVC